MARRTIEERLAQLDNQRKTLQARLGQQERAKDTRRKVLLGAFVLHRLENAPETELSGKLSDWVVKEFPGFLTRDVDHELFTDLIPRPGAKPPAKGSI